MASLESGAHNASQQSGVLPNPDPALDLSNEHHHSHLHHSSAAAAHVDDEIAYSKGTTADPSLIPTQLDHDQAVHRRRGGGTDKDLEKGAGMEVDDTDTGSCPVREEEALDPKAHWAMNFYSKYRIWIHCFIEFVFTGWWIVGLVLHRHDKNWIIPFLLWLAISLRILFFYAPITIVTVPMHVVWEHTGVRFSQLIPERLRTPLGGLLTVAVILIGTFASPESADNTRKNRAVSCFGLVVFIFGFYITSRDRSKIVWHTVIVGMLMQFIIALFVLRTKAGYDIFNFISTLARELLGFADNGLAFLTDSDSVANSTWFLVSVIPPIIFFVSFVQLLYYWGTLQWAIRKFSVFFFWSMRVSGAEAVVASASPFIGQGESAMLIKPFVPHLTKAEIHQVMTSGFATIAGSVLVAYIALGLNSSALISSCVMSIPASLAISKLRYPETEETLTAGRVVVPDDDEHRAANALHAFANGAWLGLKIAAMICATLLCIIALVHLIDGLLTWWGRYLNLQGEYDLTLELILGYVCYPIAFLLGVSREGDDLLLVGRLIGVKIIINEFYAFDELVSGAAYATLSSRSRLIATYACCGFGNIGSLGTQIGVLSQISPGRSGDVSRVAMSALISGIVSTLTSASIAGMLVINEETYFSTST